MKSIPLTQGKFALVDDKDFEWLSQWKWFINSGYAARNTRQLVGYRLQSMHREIMDAPAGMEVDHINGNRLDNRRENLRLATSAENNRNRKTRTGGSSQYKGVDWHKNTKKWRAQIRLNGKQIHLGLFVDEIEAARAYDRAALEYFGEFALLNFPNEV